jgi:hypothetical protein
VVDTTRGTIGWFTVPEERHYIAFSGPEPGEFTIEPEPRIVSKGFEPTSASNRIIAGHVTLQTAKNELIDVFPDERETISKIGSETSRALYCSLTGHVVEKVLLSDPVSNRHYFVCVRMYTGFSP